jgi:flagellar basal-body rod protein FlgC
MKIQNSRGPLDIAVSGMRAHSQNMEVISSNIANARTTDAGQGQPYRRLEATFRAQGEGPTGVEIDQISPDKSTMQRIYDPGNPKADASGYITMPNVHMPIEMMNLTVASRAYQANAAVLKRYQKMVETTLELLR